MQAIINNTTGITIHNILIFKMLYVKLEFIVRSDEPIAEMIKPVQRMQIEARNKLHPVITLIIFLSPLLMYLF